MRAPIKSAIGFIVYLTAVLPAAAAEPRWPTQDEIEAARNRGKPPAINAFQPPATSGLPELKSQQPMLDLESMARRYANNQAVLQHKVSEPQLRIFVTLTMPEASLKLIAAQAAQTGATVVIRGLKDESMKSTLAAVQRIIGESPVAWQIDPPAFNRFAVTRAPTIVLSTQAAKGTAQRGCAACATAGEFVSVAGDVSLAYALNHFARAKPTFAADAQRFLSRLETERNQ